MIYGKRLPQRGNHVTRADKASGIEGLKPKLKDLHFWVQ